MSTTKGRALLMLAILAILAWGVYMALNVGKAEAADVASPIEGEDFSQPAGSSVISGAGYSGGAALKLTAAGTASHAVNCTSTCDVTLLAQGGQSGGQASLSVNGSPSQVLTSNTVQPYTFDVNLPAGSRTVNVTASGVGTGHNAIFDVAQFPASGGTTPAQCADGIDNDGDGKIDLADPGCSSASDNDETNAPPTASPVIVGAGDIAAGSSQDNDTGDLVRQQLSAGAFGAFTLGDNAYPDGLYTDYTGKYDKSWGSFKSKTYPVYGNHDYYGSASAAGADQYWASGTGTALPVSNAKSFYAYNVGTNWRVIVLNSASTEGPKGNNAPSCASGSAQMSFLNSELNTSKNTVLMWHHSRFSNGSSHDSAEGATGCSRTFWDTAFQNGGDLVLSGHSHIWERFSDRKIDGSPDGSATVGLTQITAGTGGGGFDGVLSSKSPQPDKVIASSWGIAKVSLNASSAKVDYLPAPGAPGSDSVTVPVR